MPIFGSNAILDTSLPHYDTSDTEKFYNFFDFPLKYIEGWYFIWVF